MATKSFELARLDTYNKAVSKPEDQRNWLDKQVITGFERDHPEMRMAVGTTFVKSYKDAAEYAADLPVMTAVGWEVVTAGDIAQAPSIMKRAAFGLFARTKHTYVVTYKRSSMQS